MNKTIYKRFNIELVEEGQEQYESIKIKNTKITSTQIATQVNKIFRLNRKPEEYLILLCLNTKNYINGIFEVSHGNDMTTTAPIANILKRALLVNSNKIIICHNHPSGDLTPSQSDYIFTDHLYDAAELIGIKLLDHIIIGNNDDYNSILGKKEGVKI